MSGGSHNRWEAEELAEEHVESMKTHGNLNMHVGKEELGGQHLEGITPHPHPADSKSSDVLYWLSSVT